MEDQKLEKKPLWKNWLIKKLLSSESNREEILNYIATSEENEQLEEFEDNNEKNLIKNILKLNDISVEDVMVPRAEIVAIEKNHSVLEMNKKNNNSKVSVLTVKSEFTKSQKITCESIEKYKKENLSKTIIISQRGGINDNS